MQEIRANEKIFFFLNETYDDSNLTFHGIQRILDTMSVGKTNYHLHRIKGMILSQQQLVQKAHSANGDYYEQMNYNNFSKLLLQVPQ
jgi:hypothetical protein